MATAFQRNAFQDNAFQIDAVVDVITGRGRGGWGAGLNVRRRQGQPEPLSRIRKLSELDELPPKPVIVKPSVTTPAVTLAPSIQDEEEELIVAMIVHGLL